MIVKRNKSDFESYIIDAANIKGDCEAVYFPQNEEELCELLKEFNEANQKVTISAGRTGLNSGSVPQDGVLISLERLNKIISIDNNSKYAIVQPGVVLEDFQNEVQRLNLFYPPDPTETNCTIGGTVANNSSGARTFKYGPTRNFIEEITVILPTGEKLVIKRGNHFVENFKTEIAFSDGKKILIDIPDYKMPNVKHAAGYYVEPNMDLIDLFIGSEGTLGVISQIKLKLIDLPENVLSMVIFFNEEENLFSFINEIRLKSKDEYDLIDLREIEFFDKNSLQLLREDYQNIPLASKGAVWIEQEYKPENEEQLLMESEFLIDKHNGDVDNIWFALNENERNKLKVFRHKLPLKVNDIISARGLIKVGTDTAVPDENFKHYYQFTVKLIEENNLDYVVYGHIGNSHLHFNMLPKDENELKLCRELYGTICEKSLELNGTISAEHGIGKLKTNYLLEMFGEENILKMAKLKKSLDPNMILNIGNMFQEKYLKMVKS
jgi:D-lactate dehydrogenase (cytochrome)